MPLVRELTDAEWARIAAVLPPPAGVGRPRGDDREAVGELLCAEALAVSGWSLQAVVGRDRAGALAVKRRRWHEVGAWSRIVEAGEPVVARMRRDWRRKIGG